MTRLLLLRHGNTIPDSAPAIWVGGRTDMPLTTTGMRQAEAAAQHILHNYKISAVLSGPLLRTQQTAAPIAAAFGLAVQRDERLRELDYGAWEGLTNDAIAAQDAAGLALYQQQGIWPAAWGGPAAQAQRAQQLQHWLAEIATNYREQTLCAVTSNGILRLLHEQLTGTTAKVRTGGLCLLNYDTETWQIELWDQHPGSVF